MRHRTMRDIEVERDARLAKELQRRLSAVVLQFAGEHKEMDADVSCSALTACAALHTMAATGMEPDDFGAWATECARGFQKQAKEVREVATRASAAPSPASQAIPTSETFERPVDDGKTEYILGHNYEVLSWRPGPPRSGPTTEVHIHIPLAPGMKAVMRLKSARALDEFVGILLEYRKEVWGGGSSS